MKISLLILEENCAATWGGGDIGSQANIAAATLYAANIGGRIHILPGNYLFSTSMVFSAGPTTLDCDSGSVGNTSITATTRLTYTGSGTAITIGNNNQNQFTGCTLIGPSAAGATIGLVIGGNGIAGQAIQSTFSLLDISGFGTCIQFGQFTFIDLFLNNHIHSCGTDMLAPFALPQFGENITFLGGSFTNDAATNNAACINLLTPGDFHFRGVSFDNCGFTMNAATNLLVNFSDDHFEDSVIATNNPFITIGSLCNVCTLTLWGGYMQEDHVSAKTSLILESSGVNSNAVDISINATQFISQEAIPVVTTSGSVCCQRIAVRDYQPGTNITAPFTGTWLGTIFELGGNQSITGILTAGQINQPVVTNHFAGVSACSGGTKAITFNATFVTTSPVILVLDETTKGGANITAKFITGFTVSCTGATDVFDWFVVGNPN